MAETTFAFYIKHKFQTVNSGIKIMLKVNECRSVFLLSSDLIQFVPKRPLLSEAGE